MIFVNPRVICNWCRSMNSDFLKPYNFKDNEEKIYWDWERSGFFNPDNLPGDRKEPYTIMIAPPNITGSLHMGHALENTISDILVRYYRMKGYKTLWVPGTDHAGIATQNVVEKQLKEERLSRHDLGRDKFLEKVWEWKEKYGDIILNQLKKLGASCDWSRTRFTMDENYQEAVKEAFKKYYDKGLIYQGERVINWCIKDQTALSDLELEYTEEKSLLWYFRYPLKDKSGHVVVATTRPETMLGDTAVAVNPKDDRYKRFIGKIIILPIVNREIPIIADQGVDREFGTGAVKVTPAHDMADSEIAERNQLPFIKVINEKGEIINVGVEFDNLSVSEAREKVIGKFKDSGLFEKEEEIVHNIAKCYRCNSTIEPMLSKQWFLKMKPLAQPAIEAIRNGKVKYSPERWKDIALNWLENVKDWCISRQIWWGHPIPIEGSNDTFDTWFSSALWPFATLGWPEKTKDLDNFYPTSFITSAREIIHLWISRMIFSGLSFMDKVPFENVFIHSTILTKDGKRMSKSLGTGIDPLELIEKHGADATRFGLIWQSMGGQDIHWAEEHILAGKKFANKLWNIARFILTKVGDDFDFSKPKKIDDATAKELIKKFEKLLERSEKQMEIYEFGQALHDIYEFIWHEFADKYIEYSKNKEDKETKQVLCYVLEKSIKLLHPFIPFVTEAIYQRLPKKEKEFLMIEEW
ncbi:MAG: Valine-tRNA ligase [Candidatus Wolfebacteria bacterium GW2011_GWC1_43_10]|uniref:Valine--tRNA ligase n=2 Tax=Candidatus Wolfeibacteriota TaxID=1752735 RepID=A0A0G1EI22_9BACT|nr:MAG: Valine-tRNA ligase [Candidatus Wolfebacteria bacterium GW2011_GWC1_43_10]